MQEYMGSITFVSQHFIFVTITSYGPLTCSIITTTRKFFSILASVFIFNHAMAPLQWVGALLVFGGIILDTVYGKDKKTAKPTWWWYSVGVHCLHVCVSCVIFTVGYSFHRAYHVRVYRVLDLCLMWPINWFVGNVWQWALANSLAANVIGCRSKVSCNAFGNVMFDQPYWHGFVT